MLRFILKHHHKDSNSGMETGKLWTLDGSLSALETALRMGGVGLNSYEYNELIGVEVRGEQDMMMDDKIVDFPA